MKSFWKLRRIVGGLVGSLVLLAVLPAPANAYPRPGITERVSVASDGTEADTGSSRIDGPTISADGRFVAFTSAASNLVPGDTNGLFDVFVRDLRAGVTERISVATDGAEGSGVSVSPAISADGRHVAFWSAASNLVPGDTNQRSDVFVRNLESGTTERVSVATDGAQANASSVSPAISADGRYVAFESDASNLVPGDTNVAYDVFVRDRQAEVTERVSEAGGGDQANASSMSPAITPDGRYVAFTSEASNLVPGGTTAMGVFVRDRQTGTTQLVSVTGDGTPADSISYSPAISADGGSIAFISLAANLVPGDINDVPDAFVHDRQAGVTERVSVASDGAEAVGDASSYSPVISADGRYVAFASFASNLVPGDTNETLDAFVRDRHTGVTEQVAVASDGAQPNQASGTPAMSADGRYVAFTSYASNLVPGDTNSAIDVFLRDRGPAVGVGGISALSEEGRISVSGWATFSGAIVISVADPSDDGMPGAKEAGGELTGAVLTYRPEQEDILVRLRLASLPESFQYCRPALYPNDWEPTCVRTAGGAPAVLYGFRFAIGDARYEVRAVPRRSVALRDRATASSGNGTSADASHFGFYSCDLVCTEHALLTGSIGTTGTEVLVSVPLSALGAPEGTELSGLRAFTATGEATPGALLALDEVDLASSVIPASRVELGIAPASAPEDDVAFTVDADLAAGDFSGTIPTAGLSPGSYRAWARACLGDACGPAAAAPVTLGDGPSSSPTPTATPTESPTPTPTPTESPAPDTTEVAFTADSATAGQHTDPTRFGARLADSDGDPIAGATLTFTLTGEESSRDFTATTDPDGIASVTPTLNEKPGPHQLTVRFAGDDDHAGDADTVSFVVDKEDSALELSVHGEDDDKTLSARLSDLDTSSEGIAQRTIDFYSDGELIGSQHTDANGGASVALPPRHRGNNRTYEAVFDGDDFYLGSSDEREGKGKGGNGGGSGGNGAEIEGGRTYAGKMLLM